MYSSDEMHSDSFGARSMTEVHHPWVVDLSAWLREDVEIAPYDHRTFYLGLVVMQPYRLDSDNCGWVLETSQTVSAARFQLYCPFSWIHPYWNLDSSNSLEVALEYACW